MTDFIEQYLKDNELYQEVKKTYKKKVKIKKEDNVVKYSTENSGNGNTLGDLLYKRVDKNGHIILKLR